MNKKILASVLAVVLAVSGLSAFSATASAANLTSGDYTYSVNSDGTVCIEKYNGYQSSVRIPSTIDGKSVTKLAYHSFANNKDVINITLPNTITSAGEEVFLNSSLQSATLEYGTKAVPSGMFMYAQNLSKVTLPSTLEKIEAQAFGYEIGSRINDFVISGYQNTAAERYAAENEFTFIALDRPELIGDVNNDSKLDVADVTYLQMYLSGDSSYVIQNTKAADANGDGKIDVADVTQIQNIIALAA